MAQLDDSQRRELTALARSGKVEHRVARRANALILLDKGWSRQEVAEALLLDDDTIREWQKLYLDDGVAGLKRFEAGGSNSDLNDEQMTKLAQWMDETVPKGTKRIGAWIRKTFDVSYSKSGLSKLLHRIGFDYLKPTLIPRKIDEKAQAAFIKEYEDLLNSLGPNETVMFIDAVHPAHQVRAAGCWVRRDAPPPAVSANSGRENLNVHGAIDLSTGQTVMIDALRVNETTTIALLERIEARNPLLSRIVIYADNAAYHKTQAVREWLARVGCRIELRFIPTYCPHLNPIERLWGAMHKYVTHNRCYATRREFCEAALKFLRETVPNEFHRFRNRITDNFRIVKASDFRVLT